MDRETALVTRWTAERPMYEAWGAFVAAELTRAVAARIEPMSIKEFFKIPASWRAKDETSMLDKAFYRKKPYDNPYDDIEDKVGVRVVVLFLDDIRTVAEAVNSCKAWTAAKARDYEDEQMLRPYEFDYQSVHYVVRSKDALRYNGHEIAENLPCEIQIRTLLQHAYSELTHDTIYKPNVAAQPDVKRVAAKSMALIEATGDYFSEVKEKLALAAAPGERVSLSAKQNYTDLIGNDGQPSSLNTMLIDHFRKWAYDDFEGVFKAFVHEKSWLRERIAERAKTQALYRQPAVLLVYWVVSQSPASAAVNSPLTNEELSPIYSDLGMSIP